MENKIFKRHIPAAILSIIIMLCTGGCASGRKIIFTQTGHESELQDVSMNIDAIILQEDGRIEIKVIWQDDSGRDDLLYGGFYDLFRYDQDEWIECTKLRKPQYSSHVDIKENKKKETFDLSIVAESIEKDTLYQLQSSVTDEKGKSYNSTVTFHLKETIRNGLHRVAGCKYLAMFSSSSGEYFYNKNKEMRYIIENGLFAADASKVESREFVETVSYTDPQYVTEEIGKQIVVFGDITVDLTKYWWVKCQKVLDQEGNDTGYRIYYLDDEVYIGHFDWYGEKKDAWWCEYIFSVER